MNSLSQPLASLSLLVAGLITGTATAQFGQDTVPEPDPQLEQATFRLPDGFEVNLFAADPLIAKPVQMNFDEAGRLWIVSSEVYPHIEPGGRQTDKVLVIEDVDHDGVADETHVFADGLLIPTGIAPGDGGAWVANSTELLHFADTDGDLKADTKRVVLSGFGTEDTHHLLHTLRWGPDGYLYFNQSIYIHSHVETPWGIRRLNAGGIWQFRPETLEMGVFMRGLVNCWGHHFDRFGQSFATDGAGGNGINYVVPGASYATAANADRILGGLNPGSPKHCGLEIVETPQLPPDWQGNAITNDFRGHRVCRFRLSEDRSGYVSQQMQEVIHSDHPAFRPIDVKLGPDGAIYIADWYNPIIQHGEVDFRDPRRDHTHGRIWRVTWKGAPKREQIHLTTLPTAELLEVLRSPDQFRRQAVKQILRQRGSTAVDALQSWYRSLAETPDTEHLRLEALWCCQCLRIQDNDLLKTLLHSEDGRVRAAAVRVLSHWWTSIPESTEWLTELVNDKHPRVRLEAVRALSFSPNADSELVLVSSAIGSPANAVTLGAERVQIAMQAADHPTDTFLDYALWLTAKELAPTWLPAFASGAIDFGGQIDHILTAFSATNEGAPVEFLLTRMYAPGTSLSQRGQICKLVVSSGKPPEIAQLVSQAVEQRDQSIVEKIRAATHTRGAITLRLSDKVLDTLLTAADTNFRHTGMRAAGQWQVQGAAKRLRKTATDNNLPIEDRKAACDGLALSGTPAGQKFLMTLAGATDESMTLRSYATALLARVKTQLAAKVAVRLFAEMKSGDLSSELAASFMKTRIGDLLLAEAMAGTSLETNVARGILKAVRESGRPSQRLESIVKTAGNISSRKNLSAAERQHLLQMAQAEVTAAEGEEVFRMDRLGCLKCHAIGGAGGKVGPDMVSLGGSAQPDYLLESLLDPNAKVKENYHTIVIATMRGKLVSGIQVRKSNAEVTVRTASGDLVTVSRDDIDEEGPGVSLMPEGQIDTLTDREIAALVRFMSELGRTPDYTISRRQFSRTWQAMQATQQAAHSLRRKSYISATTDDPAFEWKNLFSRVDGSCPLADIPAVPTRGPFGAKQGVGFLRCGLEVETPGTLELKLNSKAGLELWLNKLPLVPSEQISIDIQPGIHRLTVAVNHGDRTQPIELEIQPESTTAVVRFVN